MAALEELLQVIRRHHPAGRSPGEPGYAASPEAKRLLERREQARTDRARMDALHAALAARLPDIAIYESTNFWYDAAYVLAVVLPPSDPDQPKHVAVGVAVSVLGPYYMLHQSRSWKDRKGYRVKIAYEPDREVEGAFEAIGAEVERIFGAERVTPRVGLTRVPDVTVPCMSGKVATVFDCLFTARRD